MTVMIYLSSSSSLRARAPNQVGITHSSSQQKSSLRKVRVNQFSFPCIWILLYLSWIEILISVARWVSRLSPPISMTTVRQMMIWRIMPKRRWFASLQKVSTSTLLWRNQETSRNLYRIRSTSRIPTTSIDMPHLKDLVINSTASAANILEKNDAKYKKSELMVCLTHFLNINKSRVCLLRYFFR